MKYLIITGMSGAGKSRAADVLEDLDYYCVDNMPAALLPKLAEFCIGMGSRYENVALVTDLRSAGGAEAILEALDGLRAQECEYKILFMDADTPTIIRRYKETRRRHPLMGQAGSVEAAVALERERLSDLRARADYLIDTSTLTLGQCQARIYELVIGRAKERTLRVNVMSFGFKHGVPQEADMVLDVRFLPNPFYVPALKDGTGMDEPVYDFVFGSDAAVELMERLKGLMEFLLPQYVEEGKHTLTVAVGCTGGHHRSVAVARALTERIRTLGHPAELMNRDINK